MKNNSWKKINILSFLITAFASDFTYGAEEDSSALPLDMFSSELSSAKKLLNTIIEFFVEYGFQVLGGVIIFALGIFTARIVAKGLSKFFNKKSLDVTVAKFLIAVTKIIIISFAALIALGKFGITIAPFIAGISVIGFGTSFALQGPLSNYAAGATLIFTKPFKVGDIIEVANVSGEVQDITLPRTMIKTVDGTMIVVPNNHIIGEVIQNFSGNKRLDIVVGISYEADVDKAIAIVKELAKNNSQIVDEPLPKIGIQEFADSSINIYARLWCKQENYYDTLFDVNRSIHEKFKESGINIPFPQRDIHLYQK